MVSKKILDSFIKSLLADVNDNRFSLSSPRERIWFLATKLEKANHLVFSLEHLKTDSDLPMVGFFGTCRGYKIVFTSDNDEKNFQQMCVATVVILCGSKKALKEYNAYTSSTECVKLFL